MLRRYCLVCADPTASAMIASGGSMAVPSPVVPPADAGKVTWSVRLKGHAQSLIFAQAKGAKTMSQLTFSGDVPIDPAFKDSRHLLGWRFERSGGAVSGLVVVSASYSAAKLDLDSVAKCGTCIYTQSYPKTQADLTNAALSVADLGASKGRVTKGQPVVVQPYAILSVTCTE